MTTAINAAAPNDRELTIEELEHVSGGDGTVERRGGSQHRPVEFLKFTMKLVTVS